MRIKLTEDRHHCFDITLRKGTIHNARREGNRVQMELDSGLWGTIPNGSFVEVHTYRVPVSWSVCATMEIEAESQDDAIANALEAPLPTDNDYLDGSFKVDEELLDVVN